MEVKKKKKYSPSVLEKPPRLVTFSSHAAALTFFNELSPFKTQHGSLSQMKENQRDECAEFQKPMDQNREETPRALVSQHPLGHD